MGSFHRRFKDLRISNGWTQDEIAELLGTSRATIAGYESQEKNRIPREDTLIKVANLYKVSIDYLLGRTDNRSMVKENSPSYDFDKTEIQFLLRAKKKLSPKAMDRFLEFAERNMNLFEEDDQN